MTRRVTLRSVADAVGVSRMTVSNAFSRPDQLSEDLRARILAAAAELGYAGPDPAARVLSTGRSGTIGVLFTDQLTYAFTDPVAGRFLSGVAAVLEPADLALAVLASPRAGGGRIGSVATAVVDGLVVYSVDADSPGLAEARRRGLPLVFADQAPEPGVPGVVVDDAGGAAAAARHLRELGHRRTAVVTESFPGGTGVVQDVDTRSPRHHVVRERLAGWREGLGQEARPVVVNVASNTRQEGAAAGRLLLAAEQPPTAVLCLSDELALGVIDAARAAGVPVPGRLSVVGFDDGPAAAWATPPLTTVRQPLQEKGIVAAQLLLDLLEARRTGPEDPPSTTATRTLPTELVVRESTGPAL